MYLDIYEAIEHRRLIQMYYGGYSRIVEPRIYGSDIHGVDVLKAYQIAGCDGLGRHLGWRWFEVRGMEDVKVLTTRFLEYRQGSRARVHTMQRIYCQVPNPGTADSLPTQNRDYRPR